MIGFSRIKLLDKKEWLIVVINLTVLLFIFRTAIPAFKYPFILLYPFSILIPILENKSVLGKFSIQFVKKFILPIILLMILINTNDLKSFRVTFSDFRI